ncbi:choline dehydrogenase-like flavoprotein [Mesorhizobium australicum WSM2073]|uniref:Choline dehydrogenase-like flavoprotein n=1 Tax=Mesorhizobium australicum (strain HAMBI 3006 / LMG 24608 / WSM2073) TaxID=754035 RepID=L0KIL6_MESAW|nr:GMC family oxidoreductase [Mesorhizobium australicum]AGB44365.1 choline dehydrogenase-like flavoprotein [Mesorhizobium australicum WSM2073]
MTNPDIVIIGSGIGGATIASGLAGSGASILILERGEPLPATPHARDTRSIFVDGHYRPKEMWREAGGASFNPGNYYYVGGNSKFFGAVLIRYRKEDFSAMEHFGGVSPPWPFSYDEFEPWYSRAEQLFRVRGALGEDPTEPFHSVPYAYKPVPDEAPIARARAELKRLGLHPASLPLGVDIDTWLREGRTGWDAFPNTGQGKMDAQTAPLAAALNDPNIKLETGAHVEYLETAPDGKTVSAVHYRQSGELKKLSPKLVILSAGAVNSAVILLRSPSPSNGKGGGKGLANRSDQVGRNFMNHNSSAMLAIDPRRRNDAVYQKTLMLNDYYLSDGKGGKPLGNVQLLGKIDGNMLKANVKRVPKFALDFMAGHAVDWYLMCEDLPDPESRIMADGKDIVMQWRRSNMQSLDGLTKVMRENFRACGYPLVLSRPFDKRTPSHQCGTVKIGEDPATSPLDPLCRAFDHRNLFVVDAGFLPNSAAVNPALSIAAQALRVAEHIRKTDLAA